jgi:hypothetical protein
VGGQLAAAGRAPNMRDKIRAISGANKAFWAERSVLPTRDKPRAPSGS